MYSPGNAPQLGFDLQQLWAELENIKTAFQTGKFDFIEFTTHYKEPSKPQNGRVYRADGVSWNPGNGQGLYVYEEGWVPLATTIRTVRPPAAVLTLTGVAPYVHFDEVLMQIPSGTLSLSGFAPDAHIKANKIPSGSLSLTGTIPTVTVTP